MQQSSDQQAREQLSGYLSNIFEKVGVRSRKDLLKCLFFENLLPGMLDG